MAFIIDHSFSISESFYPPYNHSHKVHKFNSNKWATQKKNKSLTKRAIIQDRRRKYGLEFDYVSDTFDEDLVNETARRDTTRRILRSKLDKLQSDARLIPYGVVNDDLCAKHFAALVHLIGLYVNS